MDGYNRERVAGIRFLGGMFRGGASICFAMILVSFSFLSTNVHLKDELFFLRATVVLWLQVGFEPLKMYNPYAVLPFYYQPIEEGWPLLWRINPP